MVALLYFATAGVLIGVAHVFFTRLSSRVALALLLLPLCFTARAVLTGRIYGPVEMPYIAQPLSDHAAALHVGPPHNGRLADVAFQMVPWREVTRRALAAREWPLFNPYELCGDVLVAGGQPAAFSPFTLIACVLPAPLSFTFTGVIAFFVAGLGCFLFAREIGCSEVASSFAAAAWMLCTPVALQVLWPLGFAWTLFPLVLAATHRLVHAPAVGSVVLLAVALALEILAGHPETVLHVVTISSIYALLELRQQPRKSRVLLAALISGAIAIGLSAIHLWPWLDALQQTSERGLRYLWGRSPLRVAPGSVTDILLGDLVPWLRPERWNLPGDAIAGSIVLALALYSAIFVRARRTWFFVVLAVVCALIGANAWPLAQLLHRIPVFREAFNDRLSTAVPFALAMLAALAIDRLRPRVAAFTCIAIAAILGIVALLASAPIADSPRLAKELLPLVIAAAILFVPVPPRVAIAIVFALVLAQRISEDGRMIPIFDPRVAWPKLGLFQPLESVREPFRIAGRGSALLPNTATMYGLEDVRGSTAMTLAPLAETYRMWSTISSHEPHSVPDLTRPILSMMNVRFAFLNVSDPIPPGWHNVTFDMYTRLIENERVLPRAFVPRNVRIGVPSQQEVEQMAATNDFADQGWVAIEQPHVIEGPNGSGEANARWHRFRLHIDVVKHGPGFVVISEAAWRGWRAYLDGHRVEVHRADHAFLGVFVPDGKHTIVLHYLPQSFVIGRAITFATIALLVLYSTVTLFARLRGWSTSHPRRSAM